MPAAIPLTVPVEPIVATEVLLLLHVPPDVVFDKVIVDPAQTEDEPTIVPALGSGRTVNVIEAKVVPQLELTE